MGAEKIPPPTVKVEDIMVQIVFKATPEMKLREVAELMMKHGISGAPVVNKMDTVLSMIGEGDTLRLAASKGVETPLVQCLDYLPTAEKLITLQRHNLFTEAYAIFLRHKFHRIPIVDGNGRLQGLITRSMILRMFVEAHFGKKIPVKPVF